MFMTCITFKTEVFFLITASMLTVMTYVRVFHIALGLFTF